MITNNYRKYIHSEASGMIQKLMSLIHGAMPQNLGAFLEIQEGRGKLTPTSCPLISTHCTHTRIN